jgi:protein-tyrosine phosphatase
VLKKANLSDDFYVDSAGTIAAHSGERADARMRQHAQKRGYQLESISRKVNPEVDFDKFDYIVAMDDSNMSDLLYLARNEQDEKKLSKMTDYCSSFENTSVPDPYYGGSSGFELVLDLLEDASEGLLKFIQNER